MPLPVPEGAWDWVTADRITHLPKTKSGHTAIWVAVDRLTKMAHFAPCHDTSDATEIADLFVEHVFCRHGMPKVIVTDRKGEFHNKFSAAVCKAVGTMHNKSTAYHPPTNGQSERMNRVLEDMMRHFVNPRQDDWDTLLPVVEFAVNNSWQESVQNTPFYLNHGRHPRTPDDLNLPTNNPAATDYVENIAEALRKAKTCLHAARQRQKAYADQHRSFLEFEVGDQVLLSTEHIPLKNIGTRKLLMKWMGPFKVTEKIGENAVAYRLELPENFKVHDMFHVSLLKPYHSNGTYNPPPPTLMVDGEEEFEVAEILAHKPQGKKETDPKVKYLVKWKDFADEHNSWEPYKLVKDCEALDEYWEVVAVRATHKRKGSSGRIALNPSKER